MGFLASKDLETFKRKLIDLIKENAPEFDPTELNNLISALQAATDGNTADILLKANTVDVAAQLAGKLGKNENAVSANVLTLQQATGDWNDYKKAGLYQAQGTMLNDYYAGNLVQVIVGDNGQVRQIQYGGNLAIRSFNGTTWSAWGAIPLTNVGVQGGLFAQYALSIQVGGTNASSTLNLDSIGQGYYITTAVTNLSGNLPFPVGTSYWLEYTFTGSFKKQSAYPDNTTLKPLYRTYNGSAWTAWKSFS